jgi:zinc transporter
MSHSESGLIHAFVLDGQGGGRRIDWDGIAAWTPEAGTLWLHLDYTAGDTARWLADRSGIDPVMLDSLLDRDPRPRAIAHGDDLLMIIRGINQNEGAQPEDMISVRCWFERRRVITVRHRISRSLKTLAGDLERGKGPRDAAEFAVQIADRIIDGVVLRVDTLSDAIAALEDLVVTETRKGDLRARIADHRRRAIALRRFLGPERDALAKLGQLALPWIANRHREQFGEIADRMARTLEELDAARERAAVTQEELSSRLAEQSNQRLYILSMLTAVFLPLGFVCALLGVNVGGVPFQHDQWAFWALVALFAIGVGLQLYWFKKRGWL